MQISDDLPEVLVAQAAPLILVDLSFPKRAYNAFSNRWLSTFSFRNILNHILYIWFIVSVAVFKGQLSKDSLNSV